MSNPYLRFATNRPKTSPMRFVVEIPENLFPKVKPALEVSKAPPQSGFVPKDPPAQSTGSVGPRPVLPHS